MDDVTALVNSTATVICKIRNAYRWKSVVLKDDKISTSIHVILTSPNTLAWSQSEDGKYDVIYDVISNSGNLTQGVTIELKLILRPVNCTDGGFFKCFLHSEAGESYRKCRLRVLGRFKFFSDL